MYFFSCLRRNESYVLKILYVLARLIALFVVVDVVEYNYLIVYSSYQGTYYFAVNVGLICIIPVDDLLSGDHFL